MLGALKLLKYTLSLPFWSSILKIFNMGIIIGLTDSFTVHFTSWHIRCFLLCCGLYDLFNEFLKFRVEFFSLKEGGRFLCLIVWTNSFICLLLAFTFFTIRDCMFLEWIVSQFCAFGWRERVGLLSPNQWLAASGKIIWSIVWKDMCNRKPSLKSLTIHSYGTSALACARRSCSLALSHFESPFVSLLIQPLLLLLISFASLSNQDPMIITFTKFLLMP